eukprot:1456152-Pleurochrysis_carterae.AAC.2
MSSTVASGSERVGGTDGGGGGGGGGGDNGDDGDGDSAATSGGDSASDGATPPVRPAEASAGLLTGATSCVPGVGDGERPRPPRPRPPRPPLPFVAPLPVEAASACGLLCPGTPVAGASAAVVTAAPSSREDAVAGAAFECGAATESSTRLSGFDCEGTSVEAETGNTAAVDAVASSEGGAIESVGAIWPCTGSVGTD